MDNPRNSRGKNLRGFGGLIRKIAAPLVIGAASLMPLSSSNEANAQDVGIMNFNTNFGSTPSQGLTLYRYIGATDGYDGFDSIHGALGAPSINSASQIPSYLLSGDVRDPTSTANYSIITTPNGITGNVLGNISFDIIDNHYWQDLPGITADIFLNGNPLYTGIDVRQADFNNTKYDITLAQGDSLTTNISVVPEPSTIAMLVGAGLLGAGVYAFRRKKLKTRTDKEKTTPRIIEEDEYEPYFDDD